MEIRRDAVVSIEYTLRNAAGEILDQSGETPLAYLHGHGNIVPGLEKKLEGLQAGAQTRVAVSAAEGYGERSEQAMITVAKSKLPEGLEVQVGMMLTGQAEDGRPVPFWVKEVHETSVILDGNHPLAGCNLDFEVTVREVREASPEELDHGHVHGPSGHHH